MVEIKQPDELKGTQPIIIFGKDVREIHCFRKSFIYGIYLGVAGGLATFLFTSRALLSTSAAFGSLWVGVFGYWIPCRYRYESSILQVAAFKKAKKAREAAEANLKIESGENDS